MNKMDEIIVVSPRKILFGENDELSFQGLITQNLTPILNNMGDSVIHMRRGDAESNPDYKQPIPYAILTRKINGNAEVFLYKRLSGGGEARLHNKLSIGVGGHMNDLFTSFTLPYVVTKEVSRELNEELIIKVKDTTIVSSIYGLINNDLDDVGKVHIGLLIKVIIPSDAEVFVRETEQLEGQWVSLEYIKSDEVFNSLETWSQLSIKALLGD